MMISISVVGVVVVDRLIGVCFWFIFDSISIIIGVYFVRFYYILVKIYGTIENFDTWKQINPQIVQDLVCK